VRNDCRNTKPSPVSGLQFPHVIEPHYDNVWAFPLLDSPSLVSSARAERGLPATYFFASGTFFRTDVPGRSYRPLSTAIFGSGCVLKMAGLKHSNIADSAVRRLCPANALSIDLILTQPLPTRPIAARVRLRDQRSLFRLAVGPVWGRHRARLTWPCGYSRCCRASCPYPLSQPPVGNE